MQAFDQIIGSNNFNSKLLGAVLYYGNCLNAGNAKKGQADGFRIKDLSLTESIKDVKGNSMLQDICQRLCNENEDFRNFKSEFKSVFQVSETIDISIQYSQFKSQC